MPSPAIKAVVKGHLVVFRNLDLAEVHAAHCVKPHWIVLGDNDGEVAEYWVVTPADAQRLARCGYEIA